MGSNHPFIGRRRELAKLQELQSRKKAGVVVIKGRRRVGKSRLVWEFAKNQRFLEFTGLPPTQNTTAQNQRDIITHQMAAYFNLPAQAHFSDWSAVFNCISHYLTDEPTVILLDEISWMGSMDPTFIGKLKIWWDLTVERMPNVMLVFCGSISTWIERNILNNTAFFGRISMVIDLPPLTIAESAALLKSINFKGSDHEIYQILSVFGGIPWYLEQVSPKHTAEENIRRLCFESDSILSSEFDHIFHDIFDNNGNVHKAIMHTLAEGMKTLLDIRNAIHYPHSGTLTQILKHLITAGFVTQHSQWSIKTRKKAKQSLFRLSDPYMRFYLKYIEPVHDKIETGIFKNVSLDQLLKWDTIMGFQIETLLLQNRPALLQVIGINPIHVVNDNPFIQRSTLIRKGCQIDYLVQTTTNNLYVCEFKFQNKELGSKIIEEMKTKITHLETTKNPGILPVLFHLNGISETVASSNYFFRIIDICQFLDNEDTE